jgi:hypothetical protein
MYDSNRVEETSNFGNFDQNDQKVTLKTKTKIRVRLYLWAELYFMSVCLRGTLTNY